MAHNTEESDTPPMVVPGDWTFLFEAISPTTGAAVTGVTVSNIAIYGDAVSIGGVLERKIPTLTPEEVEGL